MKALVTIDGKDVFEIEWSGDGNDVEVNTNSSTHLEFRDLVGLIKGVKRFMNDLHNRDEVVAFTRRRVEWPDDSRD